MGYRGATHRVRAVEPTFSSERDRSRDDLLREIECGSVRCGVIGLGFIGSVLMNALLHAGLRARGFDRVSAAANRFREQRASLTDPRHDWYDCGTAPAILDDCNVIFVAVRNLVNGSVFDEEPLQAAAALLAQRSRRPCLVVLESTVPPGTTRRFAAELASCDDAGLFVAHAPERLSAGQDHRTLRATPHLVAGLDADATLLARAMLGKICDRVVAVSAPEVSELSKLLENAFLSVNIGLTSEVTRLCMSLGIRAQEVCRAAATKPQGFMPFHPGAGLGGHCLPNDLLMLAQAARERGWEPELLSGAITANERAPTLVVDRLESSLGTAGVSLQGALVLLVGVGFKTGAPDTTRSPAIEVVRTLRKRGASVAYLDSLNPGFAVDDVPVTEIAAANVTQSRFTAGILLGGEQGLPDAALLDACTWVLDAGGSRADRPSVVGLGTL